MSREKHDHKKKHRKDATNENEDKNERSEGRLFTKADAEAAEMAGYTADYGYPQTNLLIQGRAIPVGVAAVDESVKFPSPSAKSNLQRYDSKANNTPRSSEDHQKEHVHLPPISGHHHYPYEYYDPSTHYHQPGYLSYPYPVHHEHQLSYHHHSHPHHSHHHRRRHQHHHKHHKKEIETYDPGWWYMPVDSVHRPAPKRTPEYHYVAPKWYESSSTQSKILVVSPKSQQSPQKYADCRCEVCRPQRKTPRNARWVVNE